MGKYFGTDGFRGEAGIDLTADHAYKVGRFLGWYYNALRERNSNNEPARIVIGKDTRRSSWGTPKFCVKSNECRNRANLYVGGRRCKNRTLSDTCTEF